MPRIAGTRADLRQAKALEQIWKDQGLDNSGIEAYDVLLSYPGNNSFPNKVSTKNSASILNLTNKISTNFENFNFSCM